MRSHFIGVGAAVLGAVSLGRAQTFTQLVAFGDSLSDVGNVNQATIGISPGSSYFSGRFSNGPVWLETLSASLSLGTPLHSRAGGFDFAHGGVKTGPGNTTFVIFSFPNVGTQISQYANANASTASQLHTVWGGANDFLGNLGQNPTTIVNNLVAHVTALNNDGARYIIVPNLPLLGLTPRYNGNASTRDAYNNLTMQFNTQLAAAMTTLDAQLPAKIYQFDVASAFNQILANPAQYGFTNVAEPALNGSTVVPNPDQYLFFDDVHPTRVGHQLLGRAAFDLVTTHNWVAGSGVWSTGSNWEVAGTPTALWIARVNNASAAPLVIDVDANSQIRQLDLAGSNGTSTIRINGVNTLSASESATIRAGGVVDMTETIATLNSPNIRIETGGRAIGSGHLWGEVNNSGEISPRDGGSIGTIRVTGGLTQSAGGAIRIDLGSASNLRDRVEVSAAAQFNGTLVLGNAAGQTPLPGNQYEVITFGSSLGDISLVNDTDFAGLRFGKTLGSNSLVINVSAFPGDANLDAIVNISDFALLAASFNTAGNWLSGNFNGDTNVDISDFAQLAANFNLSAPSITPRAAIPEPSSIGLAVLSTALFRRRRTIGRNFR